MTLDPRSAVPEATNEALVAKGRSLKPRLYSGCRPS
jgi:hypothetical protein